MLSSEVTSSRREDPFSNPRHLSPHAFLWELLKQQVKDSYALAMNLSMAGEHLSQLDKAPRHDSILGEDDFDFASFYLVATNRQTIELSSASLRTSLGHLEDASQKIKGRLRGADKADLADRLQRHLLEAQALLVAFQTRSKNFTTPNRPFEIRQQYAISLFMLARDFRDRLARIRNVCTDYEFGDDSCSVLAQTETKIARIQAHLGRYRDNPSQKMGVKMRALFGLATSVQRDLEGLQAAAEAECRRQGLKFFNRQGPS